MRVADQLALPSFVSLISGPVVHFAGTPPQPPLIDGSIAAKVDYTTDGPQSGESLRNGMSGAGVKKTLQNEHGGYLIDHGAPIGRHAADGIQITMGFGGGEP